MSTEVILWIAYGVGSLVSWIPITIWAMKGMSDESDTSNAALGAVLASVWIVVVIGLVAQRLCKIVGRIARRFV